MTKPTPPISQDLLRAMVQLLANHEAEALRARRNRDALIRQGAAGGLSLRALGELTNLHWTQVRRIVNRKDTDK